MNKHTKNLPSLRTVFEVCDNTTDQATEAYTPADIKAVDGEATIFVRCEMLYGGKRRVIYVGRETPQ